jgi:trans-aconitate 2-methyltransferase
MTWSPSQYTLFEQQRNRPIFDLLARVPGEPRKIVDLGCGPGNSTELLRHRFPDAEVIGIDSSPEMVEAAWRRLPGVRFEVGDIANWDDGRPYDMIFANASFQWVPGHEVLLPRLMKKLTPGGSLAVQVPDNLEEPSHVLMREVAADPRWAGKLSNQPRDLALRREAGWYLRLLQQHAAQVDVWRTTYYHPLKGGPSDVVEWFKSTGLRPFLQPLDENEQAEFLRRYLAAVTLAYPAAEDGSSLLAFPRLFFVATCR